MAKDTKAYTPNIWKDGDIISAEKLNSIESAISDLLDRVAVLEKK